MTEKVEVVGLPGVGYLVRDVMPAFTRDAMKSFYREQVYLAGQSLNVQLPPVNFQAIIDFNLANIPKSFNVPQREEFDT
ncbi:MAG: hypothetical protein PHF31_10615 [Methylobacter sp.]|nr:hypothetical protein [Methylobacter sp.]